MEPFSPRNSQLSQYGPGILRKPKFNGGQPLIFNASRSPQQSPLQSTPPIIPGVPSPGSPSPGEPEALRHSSQQVQLAQREGPGIYANEEYIRELEAKAELLENLVRQQEPSSLKILYRLEEQKKVKTYFDCPEWQPDENGNGKLRCNLPVSNFPLYLQKNLNIAFIVYRDFNLSEIVAEVGGNPPNFETDGFMPSIKHTGEVIYSVSDDLSKAITGILGSRAEFASLLDDFKKTSQVPAPYLFVYHSRHFIDDLTINMSDQSKRQLAILLEYVSTVFKTEYEAADSLVQGSHIRALYEISFQT